MDGWMGREEAAEALGVSLRTLNRMVQRGQVERRTEGRQAFFRLVHESSPATGGADKNTGGCAAHIVQRRDNVGVRKCKEERAPVKDRAGPDGVQAANTAEECNDGEQGLLSKIEEVFHSEEAATVVAVGVAALGVYALAEFGPTLLNIAGRKRRAIHRSPEAKAELNRARDAVLEVIQGVQLPPWPTSEEDEPAGMAKNEVVKVGN